MKLLIITQSIDVNSPTLGFFCRWVEEFAKHCEQVTVIALGVGEYHLPNNVRVFSLGKEEVKSQKSKVKSLEKFKYIFNFYRLIWRERKNYDVVFVHMNQEYVLLGGVPWKLLGKKITMWRNHPVGNFLTNIAVALSDKVFCTSEYSYTAQFKKTNIMPVGIDTDTFFRDRTIKRKEYSILFLGRISPVKNIDVLIDALNILEKKGIIFVAGIYGNSADKDKEYYKKIRASAVDLEKKGSIFFYSGVPNTQTPAIYNQYELFVNATPCGSFDKTILEAMACECLVVTSNKALKNTLPERLLFKEGSAVDLAERLREALLLTENEKMDYKTKFHQFVTQHDLSHLAEQLFALMGNPDKDLSLL